jgi:hypothetical protein
LLWIALIPTVGSAFYHLRIKGWRVSGVMLTASNLAPKEIDLVQREIQEISEALERHSAHAEKRIEQNWTALEGSAFG